jgi:xanthine dehydrogenase iron-sulfur cluster and FAD-binding subunit A
MVMAIRQLIADHPNPAEDEVRHALSGNICRCTGYQNIVAAALRAAQPAAAQGATQPAADHAAEPPAGPAATQRAVANAAEPPVAESLHDNRTAGKREG